MLVLDEATSNLDTRRSSASSRRWPTCAASLTTIVVTHRVSTVRDCDRIVYLENASVRAIGTFEEVKASVPEFGESGIRHPLVEEAAQS